MTDNIKLSITVPVEPNIIYNAWLDSKTHSAFTRSKVHINKKVGSRFTAVDGYVEGELKQMILSKQIVMSWRTTDFPDDAEDSLLTVNFENLNGATKVVLLHENLPEGDGKKYRKSWKDNYFVHMKDYFSL
ncbi:MAG: SRPBCC domain-containing protein [Bacteroidetes bacterium]|nr:SRPBCC domain-containing protein [Bacteroidota bacterium]MBU1114042.1 SRPBCC domain-containing protein [Bacteroidota bacterium]MBU1798408.1 SRPBCC domain-containing protein [Bacteroidota bacterium]